MKLTIAIGKLYAFGLHMHVWDRTDATDKNREVARNLQNELKAAISDKWQKADQSYQLYQNWQAGHLTADEAISAIGKLYQESE